MRQLTMIAAVLCLLPILLETGCGPTDLSDNDDPSTLDDDATALDDDSNSDDDDENDDDNNDDNDASPADDDEATPDIEFFASDYSVQRGRSWYAQSSVYRWRGADSDRQDWEMAVLAPIWGSGPTDVYVVGYAGSSGQLPYHQFWVRYDGEEWSDDSRPGWGQCANAISGSSRDNVYQTTAGLRLDLTRHWAIYRFDGVGWHDETSGGLPSEDAALYGIWVADSGEVFAVGDYLTGKGSGWLVVQNDGGAWRQIRGHDWHYLNAVWGAAGDDVFAVGGSYLAEHGSTGLHYDGVRWRRLDSLDGLHFDLESISGSSASDIYVGAEAADAGKGGALIHYDGETWANIPLPVESSVRNLWVAGPSSVYLPLGTDGIWHWDGEQWTKTSDIDASYLWGYVHPPGERK